MPRTPTVCLTGFFGRPPTIVRAVFTRNRGQAIGRRGCLAAILAGAIAAALCGAARAQSPFEFGFAKVEITPQRPLRLSGYANRTTPFTEVETPLFVRAMAIRSANGELCALVSVDTIGFPASLTKSIAQRVAAALGIPRSRFVICSTHSHTAPHLDGGLTNLLTVPLSPDEAAGCREYTRWIGDQTVEVVKQAIEALEPGRLMAADGRVGFARNRRLVVDGRHAGFGINTDGPTDHALPLLAVLDSDGAVRGVLYNYACHCTTLREPDNRVNGDWAGYASQALEEALPGAIALCSIGCGADQDPNPDSRRPRADLARDYGRQIAAEVQRLLAADMQEVTAEVKASFGYAGLEFDRPTVDELRQMLQHRDVHVRRLANDLLAVEQRMGRLPETYPAPIHVWQFGDELCMVFLGGEVVVDYALRLRKEIAARHVWAVAYCDDVFGYVASERVRREGGYEVDGSMVFYNQPGPWAEGTEEVLVRRIHEVKEQNESATGRSVEQALGMFRLAPGYDVDVVAAEPLIADPVAFAVGADGRLWVVEMGDYPRGIGDSGAPGGQVKVLDDDDRDGRYDRATVFLDGLDFPNGVHPWRQGIVVSCGGQVLFAQDTDGDDRADQIEPLLSGLALDNPQHRFSGFAYGLDHRLYVAAGTHNGPVTVQRSGATIDLGGLDFCIDVDAGVAETVGGQTQFGRYRDDWGDWFGGDNSHPIRHIVVDDRYLRRNPFVVPRNQEVDLMSPAFAPPVFPASRTVDRFNDLYAANRFTSACSPAIVRDARLDLGRDGAALVCEPVHNLVHRAMLQQQGCTFRATRHPDDAASEFCASTDTWFRPVAARMGPDGSVWIVDMYRHVIEHPQWIPEAWQAELDLRAGCRQGRIYRVFPKGESLDPVPNLALLTAQELVAQLDHPNGWRRDTAQRLILERREEANIHDLQALLQTTGSSLAKVHALNILALRQRLTGGLLQTALDDADWRVQRAATRLCRPELDPDGALLGKLVELARRAPPPLQLQVALNLGSWNCDEAGEALAELAIANAGEAAIRSAVLTSTAHAETVLARWDELAAADAPDEMLGDLIATATGTAQPDRLPFILDRIATIKVSDQGALFDALARYERAMLRRGITWNSLRQTTSSAEVDVGRAAEAFAAAHAAAGDAEVPTSTRVSALRLLAGGFLPVPTDIDRLLMLLTAQQPIEVQSAVVERIAETGHAAAAAGLFEVWPNLSPRLQQEVITAVASRPAWHELAAAAIDAGQLDATDFDRAARSQLLATADPKLGPRWHALFGGVAQESSADLAELQREVEQFAGDSPRGSELFAKHCATCHRHGEIGNDLGPKLAALSDKSTAVLLTAIVTPNRAIEAKYESYTCITQDGRVYAGMIRDESSQSITLAQPDGTLRAILRADVEDLKSTGVSFMPTGFERELSAKDLADLFAFLRSDGASAR